jgi:hypothetical protein
MFNSETLEVGIGMVFLFLLMSLICTAVKEWIEGIFKWRAMDLERALRTLLDDPGGKTTALVLQHPLIYSLYQGHYDPSLLQPSRLILFQEAKGMPLRHRRNLPSYIPAAQFATAFIDLVARGPAPHAAADDEDDSGNAPQPIDVAALRERAALLASAHLRRAMLAAIDQAGGDLARVKTNLQAWFDGTMDRASGWYKRRTQAVLFMLGLAVAVLLNVDALHVMERLTLDKTFRDAVVQQAAAAKSPEDSAKQPAKDRFDEAKAAIDKTEMPVGWKGVTGTLGFVPQQLCARTVAAAAPADSCTTRDGLIFGWLRTLLGWLVTAFAVMLGAPFWFDVLNKFMVIRSTVKPHEKSPEEASEDRAAKKPEDKAVTVNVTSGTAAVEPPASPPAPAAQAAAAPAFEPHEWASGTNPFSEVRV